ncbi:NHL repeat-containing protein [Mucilaginibacter endophyticus]|uniref:NHL repeat-containing protein n=1 Tax=Mucilaginibacter endophyticus TaxID=2675003 RepID=UPI000E0DD156|nr:NHL repeat-containing protein [Mucilaginibacter endophyticus]
MKQKKISVFKAVVPCVLVLLVAGSCSKKNTNDVSQPLSVIVTTLAGDINPGKADGTGTAASFNRPSGMINDAAGNIYVADAGNNLIRKVTSDGKVTTFAGSGDKGDVDGIGTAATFNNPVSITLDGSGNLYVAESTGKVIRKITSAGAVTTLAGGGTSGADGTGTAAGFTSPTGIAVDANGVLYVADVYKIRKVTSAGVVTTFAGSGVSGSANGTGTAASFSQLTSIIVGYSGNLYVTDSGNNMIRKITSDGVVSTLAGNGTSGSTDGTGNTATFTTPISLTADNQGNIYVGDSAHLIRAVDVFGKVTTIAGTGFSGLANGEGSKASFSTPYGMSVGVGKVYVADTFNNMIRVITAQ